MKQAGEIWRVTSIYSLKGECGYFELDTSVNVPNLGKLFTNGIYRTPNANLSPLVR